MGFFYAQLRKNEVRVEMSSFSLLCSCPGDVGPKLSWVGGWGMGFVDLQVAPLGRKPAALLCPGEPSQVAWGD